MPAPGDQHSISAILNPFDEKKPRISEYTAQEVATLQSRLEKQLGPEYITARAGPGGGKVHYIAAEKCIQLANEIFGFNGWSSTVKEWQVDFVDENATTLKISMGISVIVRVTLRDGTFHEDIGYGHIENCKGKAAAFEKCKKEGTTDALKRALRNFGNALGNCIYDKDYIGKVTKMKVQPGKWDPDRLHRHVDHAPIKKETEPSKLQSEKSQMVVAGATLLSEDTIDDEFEDGDFDDADFAVGDAESHPDEVFLPAPVAKSHHFNGHRNDPDTISTSNQNRPAVNRQQPVRPSNGPQGAASNNSNLPPQPQTPNGGFNRSSSGSVTHMRPPQPPQDAGPLGRPNPAQPVIAGRVLNQPSRMAAGPPSAPASPARSNKSQEVEDIPDPGMPPAGKGFFSARAAPMVPEGSNADILPEAVPHQFQGFNTKTESPSIRKTPGIDHKGSRPVGRDLKQIQSSQVPAAAAGGRPSIVNPQLDATRRIGAPASPSPNANRGQYKPPTMKRPIDGGGGVGRPPLADLPANEAISTVDVGGDVKRQRNS